MMTVCILGKKLGMTQVYDEKGNSIPVTVVEAGPCPIVQRKTQDRDGYVAVQMGFQAQREKRVNRPRKGHFDAAGVAPTRILREFRLDEDQDGEKFQVGEVISAETFLQGDVVNVTGTSKGKGFQGGVKRHGWSGGRATHGSMFHRSPGSIGASAYPSRVVPGHPLPGHMGDERVTVRHLHVVRVLADQNLILLKGSVPGPRKGVLEIRLAARSPEAVAAGTAEKAETPKEKED
jgi:large subunit ribosomal protein L3